MKFLLLIAVVLIVVWIVRRGSQRVPPPREPAQPPGLEDMVSCAQCGIHLPRSEALPGRGGLYCSEPHRSLHERELAGR